MVYTTFSPLFEGKYFKKFSWGGMTLRKVFNCVPELWISVYIKKYEKEEKWKNDKNKVLYLNIYI